MIHRTEVWGGQGKGEQEWSRFAGEPGRARAWQLCVVVSLSTGEAHSLVSNPVCRPGGPGEIHGDRMEAADAREVRQSRDYRRLADLDITRSGLLQPWIFC